MRRSRVLIMTAVCLLTPLALYADGEVCQKDELFSELRARSDVFVSEGAHEVDPTVLFYRFPTELGADSGGIAFVVRRNGRPLFVERISLIESTPVIEVAGLKGDGSGGTVVEVLSLYPDARALLREMADAGAELEVSVHLAGERVDVLSFADLASRSEALQEDMPTPHALTSRLTVDRGRRADHSTERPIVLKYTCEEVCLMEQDYCHTQCGGAEDCYQYCDDQYVQCLDSCTCEENTQVFTTTQQVSYTIVPGYYPVCGDFWHTIDWYVYAKQVFKITTTTVTHYSDCTYDQTVTVTYQTIYCYGFYSPGPCLNPITILNRCT